MIPFFIAIPAAWLGYCLQRRLTYLQQLRLLWSRIVDAVQSAMQYTYCEKPEWGMYAETLKRLSIAIDEIRGVFCNLGESESSDGLYPFEPLKNIHAELKDIGFNHPVDLDKNEAVRNKMFYLWKDMRCELLKEFDREEPTFHHSHWANMKQSRVYEDNDISI